MIEWILMIIVCLLSARYVFLPIYVMGYCEYKDWQREKTMQLKKRLNKEVKDEN